MTTYTQKTPAFPPIPVSRQDLINRRLTPAMGWLSTAGISERNLAYNYSRRTLGDDPRHTGEPDRSMLNRGQPYEMVDFINWFCKSVGCSPHADCQSIERAVHYCPGDIRSRAGVANWIWDFLLRTDLNPSPTAGLGVRF